MRIYQRIFRLFLIFTIPLFAMASENNIVPPIIVQRNIALAHILSGANKKIITRNHLQQIGAHTLSDALHSLSGVQLQDTTGNGAQASISMRGFGANAGSNSLFLVNGIPITNPDIASLNLNLIPLQDIAAIEIVSGSESVLYGDQAVGGVINLITREKTPEKAALSCMVGSYAARNCYVNFNIDKNNMFGRILLNREQTQNYRDHNAYWQNTISAKLSQENTFQNWAFHFQFGNESMQYPGALSLSEAHANRHQATNDTDFFTNKNGFIHLNQQQQFGDDSQINTDLSYRIMNGDGVLTSHFNQRRQAIFLKNNIIKKWQKMQIKNGIDIENDRYDLGTVFGRTVERQQKDGLFSLLNYWFTDTLALSFGARGALQNSHMQNISDGAALNRALATTVGLRQTLLPHLSWYLCRAGSFRFPKAEENASAEPPQGLRTQRGVAYETGMNASLSKVQWNGSIYQLNLRDEIAFDPQQTAADPFGTNRNLAPTKRTGLMMAADYQLTEKFVFGGQYDYVNARFQSGVTAGKRIPLVAENLFHVHIDDAFYEHWHAYLEAIFTGSEFAANDNANIAGKLGGYTIYNFNLRYEYHSLSASLHVNNIFNKYYYLYAVYQTGAGDFFYPAATRNIMLTVNYLFL